MHNWSIIEFIYLYDGSLEGLFTVVYKCLTEKKIPQYVTSESEYIGSLFDQKKFIETNFEYSAKLITEIVCQVSELTLYYVYNAFHSGDPAKANTIVRYLIYAFKYGRNINYMKSLDQVIELQRIGDHVTGEAHRLMGFLRFRELSNKFLYAEYKSDNDVLEILAKHFKKRLKMEIWMIHDQGRQQVALYNRKDFIITDASNMNIFAFEKSEEDKYLRLWKDYFKNISIKERENRRCQRNFMPKKYWAYLPETHE